MKVSSAVSCTSSVSQGSVLGPVLFLLYQSPIARHALCHHVYADDLNIVSAFSVDGDTHSKIEQATSAICDWYLVDCY